MAIRKKKTVRGAQVKKPTLAMDDVIVHLEKLPNLNNHNILVIRTNPELSRALSTIKDVEVVECYSVMILRDKRKRKRHGTR
jgi:hypothetical protein